MLSEGHLCRAVEQAICRNFSFSECCRDMVRVYIQANTSNQRDLRKKPWEIFWCHIALLVLQF